MVVCEIFAKYEFPGSKFRWSANLRSYFLVLTFMHKLSLQVRASQRSITANFRPLTAYIYHVINHIVTVGFSKKPFFCY